MILLSQTNKLFDRQVKGVYTSEKVIENKFNEER